MASDASADTAAVAKLWLPNTHEQSSVTIGEFSISHILSLSEVLARTRLK